jgi:putative ABC transport system substrate-binding protein
MRRRAVLPLLAGFALARPTSVGAQQPPALVGILFGSGSAGPVGGTIAARLRELGFEEGRNVAFATRSPESRLAVPAAIAALARLQPAVMVVTDPAHVSAVRDAMPTTPVVALSGDLVGAGFAQSVVRPGGLVTGVALIGEDLSAKRLEILAEVLSRPATVLILVDSQAPSRPTRVREAASALGLALRIAEVGTPEEMERALSEAGAAGVSGIGVLNSSMFSVHSGQIIAFALAAHLPVVLHWTEHAQGGALMAYGPSLTDVFRLVAGQVARILGGEAVAAIPVEQPTRISLVVNLRIARALGLTIPPALLARADEVIE